jgi:hypothetical protein
MKRLLTRFGVYIIIVSIAACGGAENKVDTNDTIHRTSDDTAQQENTGVEVPSPTTPTNAEPRSAPADSPANNRNDILANIDKYLVSSITADGNSVVVENTLDNISFERAIIEVSELKADGTPQKTDFYTLINIDPGTKKTARLNSGGTGAKRSLHVVKAKSGELTNGEMILVGSRYSPK